MDLVPASATSAVSNREPQPGLVIQYKSARARAFTTVQGEEVMGSFRLRVAHELLADLHALFLEIPGVSMQDMTIVWKSGLVRVTFGIYGKEFCEMVKFMVNRASAQFAHIMSSRSIANIQYIEAGVQHPSVNLPASLRGPETSYVFPVLPEGSMAASSSHRKRPRLAGESNDIAAQADSAISPPAARLSRKTYIPPSTRGNPPGPTPSRPLPQFHPLPQKPAISQFRDGTSADDGSGRHPYNNPRPSSAMHPAPRHAQPQKFPRPPVSPSATISTDPRLRPASAWSPRPLPANNLTAGACMRLRDPADCDVLTSSPIVRILVLRDKNGNAARDVSNPREAYVTDGSSYAWITLPKLPHLDQAPSRELQVGAAVKLVEMRRLSSYHSSSILVTGLEIVGKPVLADVITELEASPIPRQPSRSSSLTPSDALAGDALQQERDARLLAELKFEDEQRRRLFLENLLADVCRDLDSRESLVPAAMEALTKLAELTDVAMPVD